MITTPRAAEPVMRAAKAHQALAIGGAIVVLLLILTLADNSQVPFSEILQGGLIGIANGLLALGLVLTYRSDRIVNFAYGAMGGLAGTVGVMLFIGKHWSWPVCLVVALVLGGAIGALTELLIIRRFARASRLILTVATIGLAQVFGGIQILLPKWFNATPIVGGVENGLSKHSVNVGVVLFTANDLLTVIAVPIAIAALAWFLLRTDAGIAVRAVADNRDRAMLLGIPVRRLATIVWTIAGILATIAVILPAPSFGLTIDAGAGPALLLPALAAAVIARMESLPIAVFAGIGLGILDSLVRWNFNKQSVTTIAFLIVILLALILNRGPGGGRDGAEESSLGSSSNRLREIPEALARLPEVVAARVGLPLAILAAAIIIPLTCSPSTIRLFSITAIYGIVAVSLVVLSGWAGQVSLGQYAFVGVGAVVTGNLINHFNVDLFVCLVAAGVAGALIAVLVGLPALRMPGLFLAVTTMAFAIAVDGFFLNPVNFPSIIPNTIQRSVLWKRFDLTNERDLYFLCLGFLVLTVVFVQGLRRARAGRVMIAIRENPRAAAAMAVPTTRVKLIGFVTSGAIAGVAGGLHATILESVGFGTYQPSESLLVFSMLIIGGSDSIAGALLGVGLVELAVHAFPQYQLVITGTGLLVVLLVLPGGLSMAMHAIRDRLLNFVARRRHIDLSVGADGTVAPAPAPVKDEVKLPAGEPLTARMLTCTNVEARYGSMQVLFGVDLDVADGEVVALLGTNGAGKSTMLKAVAGLLNPGPGKVWFDGKDITGMTPQQRVAAGLVLMPAKSIFPSLTVSENMRIAGWLGRDQPAELDNVRERVLDLFPHLAERMGQQAGTMSGGQQQMLSLGMALLTRPRLLLIDELSLGLAPAIVARMLEVVGELVEEGMTTVIVEQSVNVALEVAERAVFLERGSARFTGETADLLNRPDVLRSVFITGMPEASKPAAALNGSAKRGAKTKPVAAPMMDLTAQPAVLECQAITKNFGAVRVLNDIDLTVHNGEILGLIGHNGAGKTTLFDVMCGFLPSDRGRVILDGIDVTASTPSDRAFLGLGRSFQEARLFPALTVAETVAVALERHLESKDLVAAALRLPASTLSEYAVNQRVGELLSQVGLTRYARSPIGELSTGTRRIVELACVLAQEPAVVLLDEPTAGVAQKETEALAPLLKRVRADTGCTMVVIDHDMPLLTGLCDRLVALELGQVIASGPPATVLEDRRVIESYLGVETATIERSGSRPAAPAKPPAKAASKPKPKPKPKAAASTRR